MSNSPTNDELQKQIGGYSDYQELMVKKYAGSGRINNMHVKDFGELDESYAFIVDSLSDDGYFDDEEQPIENNINKQSNKEKLTNQLLCKNLILQSKTLLQKRVK